MNCRPGLRHLLAILCLALLAFASGCASTGKTTVREPITIKLGQFNSARVEVGTSLTNASPRLHEFMVQLESRIIAKLRDAHAFQKIYSAADSDSAADLAIVVTIIRVRDLENMDRLMWGAFAGQAKSRATVEVSKLSSGQRLGGCEIEGKSSGGWVGAGTTPEAVDRVADEVVRFIADSL